MLSVSEAVSEAGSVMNYARQHIAVTALGSAKRHLT